MKEKLFKCVIALGCLLLSPLAASPIITAIQKTPSPLATNQWQSFNCKEGNCSVSFPGTPDHVSEQMILPEEGGTIQYDAYFSQPTKEGIFMVMVAKYPDFVTEELAQLSLEGFLNGLLNQNPTHRLIFADLILVNGHKALDFFIHTQQTYFKGRAMMIKNSFYLIAMECEVKAYNENSYNFFISSFKLTNIK